MEPIGFLKARKRPGCEPVELGIYIIGKHSFGEEVTFSPGFDRYDISVPLSPEHLEVYYKVPHPKLTIDAQKEL